MYKFIVVLALSLSGCSYVTFNAAMCDQIASDPHATVPQECRDYDKKQAEKAFNRVVDAKKVSDKDIKFEKEEE